MCFIGEPCLQYLAHYSNRHSFWSRYKDGATCTANKVLYNWPYETLGIQHEQKKVRKNDGSNDRSTPGSQ